MAYYHRIFPGVAGTARGFRKAEGGYTLVELLSVVAIIAILAAISIPAYSAYISKVRIERTIEEIRTLQSEIALYLTDVDHLPDTLADIHRSDLKDPWGHPYEYLRIDGGGVKGKGKLRRDRFLNPLNTDYDLYSMGADGKSKTNLNAKESEDDIVRILGGNYIGLASKF
ncbi:MAG: prepilin-type N-terminal cleavage/methylation domain-containing protein [Desulfuromonadaceae bacterium]|nr:prepilin-type N-terminal cleavage/methylation domain-containing protein [Desulfuromonadaceae bacterium]